MWASITHCSDLMTGYKCYLLMRLTVFPTAVLRRQSNYYFMMLKTKSTQMQFNVERKETLGQTCLFLKLLTFTTQSPRVAVKKLHNLLPCDRDCLDISPARKCRSGGDEPLEMCLWRVHTAIADCRSNTDLAPILNFCWWVPTLVG